MKKPSIYLFCPAYKDEGNIGIVINSAIKVLDEIAGKYLITIIEDGSPDRTGEVADKLAGKYENVKVIHHKSNKGYGEALKTGFTNPDRSDYDFIIYTDGDGQFNLEELKKVMPLLEKYDAVIGYRRNRVENLQRKFQSWVYNFFTKMISGLKYKDFNCSFKIFKREVVERIDIEFPTVFIDAELIIKTELSGYKIFEIGVTHYPRITSTGSGAMLSLVWGTIKSMWQFHKKYKKEILKYRKTFKSKKAGVQSGT